MFKQRQKITTFAKATVVRESKKIKVEAPLCGVNSAKTQSEAWGKSPEVTVY